MGTRSSCRKEAYINAQGRKCMVPGCGRTIGVEVHHIRPISREGIDKDENFMVLCLKHHRKYKLHVNWEEWFTTLMTWKLFCESMGSNFNENNKPQEQPKENKYIIIKECKECGRRFKNYKTNICAEIISKRACETANRRRPRGAWIL